MNTRHMSKAAAPPSSEHDRSEAWAYRHLPEVISVEDTVASVRGDSPSDPCGEQNAFIAAAIKAGG